VYFVVKKNINAKSQSWERKER